MPPPIPVELVPHSAQWQRAAEAEGRRLQEALGRNLLAVHHIGSTAIPGIHAKPILDLLPVMHSVGELDQRQRTLESLGYEYWGEYGIPGRRYCTLADPATGRRMIQLHCFDEGSSEIEKHLAFRDYVRAHPTIAREYDLEKQRCRDLHPDDSHAYSDAKAAWIESQLAAALAWYHSSRSNAAGSTGFTR
jgi:GrpB-like predicted nucleotidyltransferase (UPF0157 family)